jgi:hypothetical protein
MGVKAHDTTVGLSGEPSWCMAVLVTSPFSMIDLSTVLLSTTCFLNFTNKVRQTTIFFSRDGIGTSTFSVKRYHHHGPNHIHYPPCNPAISAMCLIR